MAQPLAYEPAPRSSVLPVPWPRVVPLGTSRRAAVWTVAAMEIVFVSTLAAVIVSVCANNPSAGAELSRRIPAGPDLGTMAALLLGGAALARAVAAFRADRTRALCGWLAMALLCACGILGVRCVEWVRLARSGPVGPACLAYLVGTRLHAAHVIVTAGLLTWALATARRQAPMLQFAGWLDTSVLSWNVSLLPLLVLFTSRLDTRGLSPSLVALAVGLAALITIAVVLLVLALSREDALHIALSGAAMLVAATALFAAHVRSSDASAADGPEDVSAPFAGTRSQAALRARVSDVGDVRELLAAALAPPPSSEPKPKATAAIAPDVLARARATFEQRCASCHGTSGKGDGPGAFAVHPPPRDYTDVAWQSSVTDEDLTRAIELGGAAVRKSFMMPPAAGDLRSQPEVIAALVAIVRDFGADAP